jgi:hypothetical protein
MYKKWKSEFTAVQPGTFFSHLDDDDDDSMTDVLRKKPLQNKVRKNKPWPCSNSKHLASSPSTNGQELHHFDDNDNYGKDSCSITLLRLYHLKGLR